MLRGWSAAAAVPSRDAFNEHHGRTGRFKQVAVKAVTSSQACKTQHGDVDASIGNMLVVMDMVALRKKVRHLNVLYDRYHDNLVVTLSV